MFFNLRPILTTLAFLAIGCCGTAFTQAEDETIADHDRWVTAVAFSGDSKVLATSGGQSLQYRPGDVKVWNAASGKLIADLKGHDSNVWSIAMSADGKTAVSSGYNGKVIVWSIPEKKAVATLEKHKGWCRSVAMAPDGKHFASAGEDGTVVIWAVAGNKEVKTIKAHESAVMQMTFSPDGKTLATASADKTAKLWDWNAAKETGKLEGHEDAVWSVAYSQDGSRIATAGADRTIRIWDASGKGQATLRGHKDWVSSVQISPDGKSLLSGSHDRSVRLWDLELAIKLAGDADAAAKKLQEGRDALATATESANSAGKVESLKKKSATLQIVIAFKQAEAKHNQVKEGADKYKDNEFLKNALAAAKKAMDEAKKASDAEQKAIAKDKPLADLVKKLAAGKVDAVKKELETASKSAADMEAKAKNAGKQKADAEKAIAAAKKKLQEIADKQAKALGEYKSSVWAVAFSPDGRTIATGSHKGALRVWQVDGTKELFPHSSKEESDATAKAE